MLSRYFSSSVGVVGIDIEHDGCHLLQLRQAGDRLIVVGAAMIDAPIGSPADLEAGRFRSQLKEALSSGRFKSGRCVISLPRDTVRLQSVRLPPMPDAEMAAAAHWEAAQRFGIERDSIRADFIRTGGSVQGGDRREEILLVASPLALLETYLLPILDVGLRPVAVETWFTGLGRLLSRRLRRESDQLNVRAVVDVGLTCSTIMVLRGDQIALCRTAPIGGRQFDAALADHLEMDVEAASELRAARLRAVAAPGSHDIDPATDRAVYEAVRPLMGDVVNELLLCLRYYGVTFRGHPPRAVLLTGAHGAEPRLDDLIRQGCKLPVVSDDEQSTLEDLARGIRSRLNRDPGSGQAWSVAAGLSLRNVSMPRQRPENAPETGAAA